MTAPSPNSEQTTFEGMSGCISSQGSRDGTTPSTSPIGVTPPPGPLAAPAPRSPQPERKSPAHRAVAQTLCRAIDELATSYAASAAMHGWPMPATYGRNAGDSSPSAALGICLENRLKAVMAGCGSPLFVLRWKYWVMPLGPRISAQRGSGRRTSGNGCGSWPSPNAGPQNDSDSTW